MQTIRLFYQDPYQTQFEAVVAETRVHKDKFQVRLNQTCFYPEGGGQPYDTGTLNDIRVTEVHESDGEIWHTVAAPIEVGEAVKGQIDWERRFDLMQQHSGEHIISGILHEMTGCDNVGFHLTPENVYIDLSLPLDADTLREAENRANRYIWGNHPIDISWPDPETLAAMEYRSKKELTGDVRIVAFPGADRCACCGTHVAASGEIGQIRLLTVQNWKGGVRVEMACGKRALEISRDWMNETLEISRSLSVKPAGASAAVHRLESELSAAKMRVSALEDSLFAAWAEEYSGEGDLTLFKDGLTPDSLRKLTGSLIEKRTGRCAVFSGNDQDGYKYAVGQKDGDLRTLVKEMNAALNGRGGGKPFFAQGSVAASKEQIEQFFAGK